MHVPHMDDCLVESSAVHYDRIIRISHQQHPRTVYGISYICAMRASADQRMVIKSDGISPESLSAPHHRDGIVNY
eukprot:2393517-Pleurochrysis_carterae.AAC.1